MGSQVGTAPSSILLYILEFKIQEYKLFILPILHPLKMPFYTLQGTLCAET
jgi:hypothetical protein